MMILAIDWGKQKASVAVGRVKCNIFSFVKCKLSCLYELQTFRQLGLRHKTLASHCSCRGILQGIHIREPNQIRNDRKVLAYSEVLAILN